MIEVGKKYYAFSDYLDIIEIINFEEKFGVYEYVVLDSINDINNLDEYDFDVNDRILQDTTSFHANSIYYHNLKETSYTSVLDLIKENPELFL